MTRESILLAAALLVPVLIACEGKEVSPTKPAPARQAAAHPEGTAPKPAPPHATPEAAPDAAPDAKAVKGPDGKEYAVLSTTRTPGGVIVEEIITGTGAEAKLESNITFDYEGKLANGFIFDSSYKNGQPLNSSLLRLVKGWQEAIPGMKVGGVRRLTIPPALGWPQGTPDGAIPPNSTTYFWIKLQEVK